jgi:colanic acid biosynthesis glycosyl transferase WcaI
MRILIVSQFFTPEPFLKSLEFARALSAKGHQVQVLTGFPNYPGGKMYPGYRIRIFQREVIEGIPVLRVPLYPSHERSALKRAWNYVSFAISAAILGVPLVKKADVMYVYHPPATVALPALVIGALRRIPVVYDVQDLWPDTLRATQMIRSPLALKLVHYWCQMTYRLCKKVVVLSPGFKDLLVRRGVPPGKIEIIYNWTLENDIARAPRNEALALQLGMAGRFNVVYAGTFGKAHGLETVLYAAERLQKSAPQVQFVLAGDGVEGETLKSIAREKGLHNVLFLPWRPVSEIGEVLNLADALLVQLRKDPLFHITIPSKIQSYLAVGKPILVGVEGDAANLITRAGAGLSYDSDSPDNLAEAAERLAQMPGSELAEMGERGRQFYKAELSFARGVDRFEQVFVKAAEKQYSDVTTAETRGR